MIKLVAFDWNGTILSDTKIVVTSANKAISHLLGRKINISEFKKNFDVPIKNYYINLGLSEKKFNKNSIKIASAFHNYYESLAIKTRTRANSRILLEWLKNKQISSLIFSNHIEDKIILQLKRLKIEKYFTTVLANYHTGSSLKTRFKKEKLREHMHIEKLKPNEVLVVGDSLEEIEIGKELECITVAITDGYCSTTRLKSAKPDYLISNLKEIIDIIKKLNKSS